MVLDVSGSFVGQAERWTASFRGTGAVAVRVSGPEMTLVPISKGWWIVTIEARSRNLIAKQTFPVSVSDPDTPEPEGDTLLDLSPEISIPDAKPTRSRAYCPRTDGRRDPHAAEDAQT